MNKNLPFSEKYRPRKIEDLVIDEIIRNKINNIIETKNIPNIIFTGNSGVGKTSTIHCIARAIYPKHQLKDCILESNASDERGIKAVHETFLNFCKKTIFFEKDYAQHKLLILDEADNLTKKAQKLINSIMDKYTNTRFVFTCNNSSDIIEAIQSRCIIIRFNKLPLEHFNNRIKNICNLEKIIFDENSIPYLFNCCSGDMRQSLNILELTNISFNNITIDNINKICDIPSHHIMLKIYNSLIDKNETELCFIINNLQNDGYYSMDILLHFIQYLKNIKIIKKDKFNLNNNLNINDLNNETLKEEKIIFFINTLSNCAYVMSKSSSNYIQLTKAFLLCI